MAFSKVRKGPEIGVAKPVYPVVAAIVERESFALALSIHKTTQELPHKTFVLLWFQLFVSYLAARNADTLGAFVEAFDDFTKTVVSIERTIAGVVQAGKSKTFQTLTDLKTIGHILTEAAASNKLALTETQLHALIHHALPGSAPAESQAEAVEVVHAFLNATAKLRLACNSASFDDQKHVLLLANLYAMLRQVVELREYNPTATMQGKGEDQNAARWAAFRSIEAKLLGAKSASAVAMVKHLLTWLSSETAARAIPLEHEEKFRALKSTYESRGNDEWPFQSRAALTAAWDPSLFAGTAIEKAGTRPGTTDLETALMQDKTTGFEDDFTIGMELSFADMTSWVQLATDVMSYADKLCARVSPLKSSGAAEVPTLSPSLHPGAEVGGVAEVSGYPLNPSYRGVAIIVPSRRVLRQKGLSPVRLVTQKQVADAIKDMKTPLRLRTDFLTAEQQKVFGATPLIEPVFGEFEEGGDGLTQSLKHLEELSNYVEGYLKRRFAELTKVVLTVDPQTKAAKINVGILIRGYAESWRHIGVLTFTAGADSVKVKPLSGHWYHGRDFDKTAFSNEVVLAEGTSADGTSWKWALKPFQYVPESADVTTMLSNLTRIVFNEVEPTQPLVRWMRKDGEMVKPTNLKITGWRKGDGRLADIYVIAAAASGTQYQFFPDVTDVRSFAVAPYNAGVFIADPPSAEPLDVVFEKAAFATLNA